MPGFDGTGPAGQGPMTGGARGYCAVNLSSRPEASFSQRGRFSKGQGGGRGRRNRFYATGLTGWIREAGTGFPPDGSRSGLSKEDEISFLNKRMEMLKLELEAVRSRINGLESDNKGE